MCVCVCVCVIYLTGVTMRSRGQVMNAELLSNVVDVELIYSGIKYSLKASRVQPTSKCVLYECASLTGVSAPASSVCPCDEWQSDGGGGSLFE